jgi:hypothetical protein
MASDQKQQIRLIRRQNRVIAAQLKLASCFELLSYSKAMSSPTRQGRNGEIDAIRPFTGNLHAIYALYFS